MKKSVFILVAVLMSVYSYSQTQDTIRLDTDSYPADTVNMANTVVTVNMVSMVTTVDTVVLVLVTMMTLSLSTVLLTTNNKIKKISAHPEIF